MPLTESEHDFLITSSCPSLLGKFCHTNYQDLQFERIWCELNIYEYWQQHLWFNHLGQLQDTYSWSMSIALMRGGSEPTLLHSFLATGTSIHLFVPPCVPGDCCCYVCLFLFIGCCCVFVCVFFLGGGHSTYSYGTYWQNHYIIYNVIIM